MNLVARYELPAIPEEILTDRIVIRAPRLEDIAALNEAVVESLAELKPWMPWAADYSLAACEASVREAVAKFVTRTDLRYHFFDRGSGQLLGSTGLHRINWSVPRFEIGYWIRSSRSGEGLMSECASALAETAFSRLGAMRVEIRCDDLNEASGRVAEKCGFELDCVLRNWQRVADGTLRHERIYSRIA